MKNRNEKKYRVIVLSKTLAFNHGLCAKNKKSFVKAGEFLVADAKTKKQAIKNALKNFLEKEFVCWTDEAIKKYQDYVGEFGKFTTGDGYFYTAKAFLI